jgi:hypothetical protein
MERSAEIAMNALICLNLNSFMPPRVRESFQHAANRWGVRFVEITEPLANIHHFWQKAIIPLSRYADPFERVLQLDCDMLVRSDCPSPFDLVPPENVAVVSHVQPGRPAHPRFERMKVIWAKHQGLVPYGNPREHLNLGLFLYSPPRHADLLALWAKVGADCNYSRFVSVPEQFALSCLLQMPGAPPVTWLPWQFNTIRAMQRKRRAGPGLMQTYIYHFNGPHGRDLPALVSRCEWRV